MCCQSKFSEKCRLQNNTRAKGRIKHYTAAAWTSESVTKCSRYTRSFLYVCQYKNVLKYTTRWSSTFSFRERHFQFPRKSAELFSVREWISICLSYFRQGSMLPPIRTRLSFRAYMAMATDFKQWLKSVNCSWHCVYVLFVPISLQTLSFLPKYLLFLFCKLFVWMTLELR